MDSGTLAVVFVVLAVALCAGEIVAPGLVLLPFGLGAGLAAVTGFLGAPVLLQLVVFVLGSLGAFLAMRPLSRRLADAEPAEGIGAQRLIGASGTTLESIAEGDTGLVRIDREEWRAEGEDGQDLPAGTRIRVVDVRGTRVVVVPEPTPTLGRGE